MRSIESLAILRQRSVPYWTRHRSSKGRIAQSIFIAVQAQGARFTQLDTHEAARSFGCCASWECTVQPGNCMSRQQWTFPQLESFSRHPTSSQLLPQPCSSLPRILFHFAHGNNCINPEREATPERISSKAISSRLTHGGHYGFHQVAANRPAAIKSTLYHLASRDKEQGL